MNAEYERDAKILDTVRDPNKTLSLHHEIVNKKIGEFFSILLIIP